MAKYSIILPVRNGGEYLKECVNSILSQTITEFNLHILDNCSTDGTTQWIQSLKDDRVKVLLAERPLSIEESWGRIVTTPKNEFMTLIGHDDLLDANYLSTMGQLISEHPDASLYTSHYRYINTNGETLRRCKPMANRLSASEFIAFFLCNMIDSMGTGFMMRSNDYNAVGGIPFYPNLLFADFELWINLTKKSYMAIAFAETFSFRIHQSTTTTSPDLKFHHAFKHFIEFLIEQQKIPELNPVITRYAIDFISHYTKSLAHRLLRTDMVKREGKTVIDLVTECKKYADELVPGNRFNPYKNYSVSLARQIDSNAITRRLFLTFKKIYPKPIYT